MQKGSIVSNPETYQIPPRQNAFFHIRIHTKSATCKNQNIIQIFYSKFNFTYNDLHSRKYIGLSIFSLISIDLSEKVV